MSYPIFPRQCQTAGRRRNLSGYGVARSSGTRTGMRSARATRSRKRHMFELSWEGVGKAYLKPVTDLIDETLGGVGLCVSPTFNREAVLTAEYASGTTLTVNDVTPFSAYTITIIDGVNDRIDFSKDGANEITASLTPGTYTPAGLAAHILLRMNLVSGGPVYAVTYSANDDRYTITETTGGTPTGILSLLWFSGTNTARSVGATLGYDVSRDRIGATTYSSDYFLAPYGSRILLADANDGYVTKLVRVVEAIDTENKTLTITESTGHTYVIGSLVEPCFNATIQLEEEEEEAIYYEESQKDHWGIVTAAVRLIEEFNA